MNANQDLTLPIAVYIHLGLRFPRHLQSNLLRHRNLFPSQRIVVIVDREIKFVLPSGVEEFRYSESINEALMFEKMSEKLDFDFQKGFWKYTFQRFFALRNFHFTTPNTPILHIESDVIVMPNFPWENFSEIKSVSWMEVNQDSDIAALVYSPNFEKTDFFVNKISEYAIQDPSTNDMLSLKKFARENPHEHTYLPTITRTNKRDFSKYTSEDEDSKQMFGGTFDPLALGLWYFGQDPKNSFGFRKRYIDDTSHFVSPTKTNLELVDRILFNNGTDVIYSLHVHSKYLPFFGENWHESLKCELLQARTRSKSVSFELRALIAFLTSTKVRKVVWLVAANIPGTGSLRRIQLIERAKNIVKRLLKI